MAFDFLNNLFGGPSAEDQGSAAEDAYAQDQQQKQLQDETDAYNQQVQQSKMGPASPFFTSGISGKMPSLADLVKNGDSNSDPDRAELDAETAAYNKQLNEPSQFAGMKDIYKSALNNLGGGNRVLAGGLDIGAGLLGRKEVAQGAKQAVSGYDDALASIKNRQDINGDAFNAVTDSPEQLAARQVAMKGLTDRATMGLTPEDQLALQNINRQAAQANQANQASIQQNMARRGMANSGLGLAQSMGAADQALQNQSLAGQQQAAQSFAAKQGALNNLAGQSNTALNADYTRQMGKATNLSAINQFNSQQRAQQNAQLANAAIGKGQTQQGIATNVGASTGRIGQSIAGLVNPQDQKPKVPGQA
jgi:hypothetical protein